MREIFMERIKKKIIEMGEKLYRNVLIVATEGNLSVRVDEEQILTTVSGVCKGELTPDDIVLVDLEGKLLKGKKMPSTEIKMHLEVYRQRSDVQAVMHAHPPYVVALSMAGVPLDRPYLPESVLMLGAVPVVPYARPSTRQVPEGIRPYLKRTDTLVLERHGSLTMGKTLDEAYFKLETLEHTARVVWLARQMGEVPVLPADEVKEILKLRKSVYGLNFPIIPFE